MIFQKIISGVKLAKSKSPLKFINLHSSNCVLLLYHRINNYKSDPQQLCVLPQNFEKHIEYLKNNCNLLSIDELYFALLNKKKIPKNSVAISFDDGYADNYEYALPILEKYNTQALIYVCTGNLNTPFEFWWDTVERIFLRSTSKFPSTIKFSLHDKKLKYNIGLDVQRIEVYNELLKIFKTVKSEIRDRAIGEILMQINCIEPRYTHRSLNDDEFKKMIQSKSVVIGAHTHGHASLANLSYDDQVTEIIKSKTILEHKSGNEIIHFSYPFGTRKDYNLNSIKAVKAAGFKMVAANYPGNIKNNSSIFELPRFVVRDWELEVFKVKLNEFFCY